MVPDQRGRADRTWALFLIPAEPFDLTNGFRNLFGWALPVLVVLVGLALIAPALRRRQTRASFRHRPTLTDRSNSYK